MGKGISPVSGGIPTKIMTKAALAKAKQSVLGTKFNHPKGQPSTQTHWWERIK